MQDDGVIIVKNVSSKNYQSEIKVLAQGTVSFQSEQVKALFTFKANYISLR